MPLSGPLELLRNSLSIGTKRRIANQRLKVRRSSAGLRSLPDFLIIGAQRSGTSSLYRYLGSHPQVAPSVRKETEFLTRRYGEGLPWYRSHFPLGHSKLNFEATPDYLLHPLAAARASMIVPEARIIVLLREPGARALSHHRHMTRLGYEELGFADALAAEGDRLGTILEDLEGSDPSEPDPPELDVRSLLLYSYGARGEYSRQLTRWLAHYDRDCVKVLTSETFFENVPSLLVQIEEFLGLDPWVPTHLNNYSYSRSTQPASVSARRILPDASPDVTTAIESLGLDLERDLASLEHVLGRKVGW